jgi:transcription-repair coupling factor (superfamily II helicase)
VSLSGILHALDTSESFREASAPSSSDVDLSLVDGLDAPAIAAFLERRRAAGDPAVVLAIAPTSRRAESLGAALRAIVPGAEVRDLPAWETLPHERLSPSPETVGRRLETLRAIATWDGGNPLIVVASIRAAIQPMVPGLGDAEPIALTVGGKSLWLEEVIERLVELAYHRVDMVSKRGDFAVRGGILDVFPPTAAHPVRIEFFGDEVDQIREFSVADQRSVPGEIRGVELTASRELLLTPEVRQRARELQHEYPGIAQMLEKMAEGIPAEGMESLSNLVAGPLESIVACLPDGAAAFLVDPERAVTRAASLKDTNAEFLEAAWSAAISHRAASSHSKSCTIRCAMRGECG